MPSPSGEASGDVIAKNIPVVLECDYLALNDAYHFTCASASPLKANSAEPAADRDDHDGDGSTQKINETLLAALKRVVEELTPSGDEVEEEIVKLAKAAIAKAEGEMKWKTWLIEISYGNKRRERVFCFSKNKPTVEIKEDHTEADIKPSLVIIDEY
jgi:uncharacterized protein YifE (UPF0438 family)